VSRSQTLLTRLPNDIGGLPAERIVRVDHELAPWEKRCHALADVLDFHKIINTEEKRRGVEALGAEIVAKLTYYERWIATFATILFQKGLLVPTDLARRMDEVAARWPDLPEDNTPAAGATMPATVVTEEPG
jgi:hypothetical protein